MRGNDHRKLSLKNFELGPNFIEFEENLGKTFRGGLTYLKYVPRESNLFVTMSGKNTVLVC